VGQAVGLLLVGDTEGVSVGLSFGELVGEVEFRAATLCWSDWCSGELESDRNSGERDSGSSSGTAGGSACW